MNRPLRLVRRDQTRAVGEAWRPPPFIPGRTRRARFTAACRRFLDLQAGSIWRDLAAVLPDCHGMVLDVGCGAQPYRALLNSEATYLGIDSADAKERFGYSLPETLYYTGDTWPVENGMADILLCTETLEHVPCPARFLAEAYRCVKPGGQIVLTVPFAARWHYIPHDYWRYTPSSLALLLTEAGFRDVAVYARGNAFTVACYKVMALLLPLLLPQGRGVVSAVFLRLLGLCSLPLLVALACAANLSLRGNGGDDCLGYTVLASK